MESITKIRLSKKDEEEGRIDLDNVITKRKFAVRQDPKLRMTYIVPEEIYPENFDLN